MSSPKSRKKRERPQTPKSRHWATFRRGLRPLLREKGKSQVQLARRLGITKQAITAWLSEPEDPPEARTPNIEHLLATADFLEVSLDRLMGRSILGDEKLKAVRAFALEVAGALEGKLPLDLDHEAVRAKHEPTPKKRKRPKG